MTVGQRTDHPQQALGVATQVAGYIGVEATTTPPALLPAQPGDTMNLEGAGVPADGTADVQTITIGGTPTGGTFKLRRLGLPTAAITWSNVNATLLAAIDAALEAFAGIGVGGVATAAGTLTAGIGTLTLTYSGPGPQPLIEVADNSMTGTAPTISAAATTPGVLGTGGGQAEKGSVYRDKTNGKAYINGGTKARPVWKIVTSA